MCWKDCFLCCLSLQSGAMFVATFGMTAGLLGFLLMPFMPFSGAPGDDFFKIMFYMALLTIANTITIISTMFESKKGLLVGITLLVISFLVWALLTIPSFIESSGAGCFGLRCGESHWLVPRRWSPMSSFGRKLYPDDAPTPFQQRSLLISSLSQLEIEEMGRMIPNPEFNVVDLGRLVPPSQEPTDSMPKYLKRTEQNYLHEGLWDKDDEYDEDNEINGDNDKLNQNKDAKKPAKPLIKSLQKPKKGALNTSPTENIDEIIEQDPTETESINRTNKDISFQILMERLEQEVVQKQEEIDSLLKTQAGTRAGMYLNNSMEEDEEHRRRKRAFFDDTSKERNIVECDILPNKTAKMNVDTARTDVRSIVDSISSIKTRKMNVEVPKEFQRNFLDDILANETTKNVLGILANENTMSNGDGLDNLPILMAQLRLLKMVHRRAKRHFEARQGFPNKHHSWDPSSDSSVPLRSLPSSTVNAAINPIEPISKLLAMLYASMFMCGLATLFMYWSNMYSTSGRKPIEEDCVSLRPRVRDTMC